MAIKTLEELNRDFMTDSPAHERKADYEPITPLAIDVKLPRSAHKTAPRFSRRFASNAAPRSDTKPSIADRRSNDAEDAEDEGSPKKPYIERRQTLKKKKLGRLTTLSDVLFSLAVVLILAVVLMSGENGGAPLSILGYSYFSVQSPSMQDEIPKGSLILVRHVDPQTLEIGDNITFMVDRTTSWTHKINDIYEDYEHSKARAFQTKGVNNAAPDQDPVYEANVVGKVIFVVPVLGAILMNLGQNVFLVFLIFGLCVLFSFLIRGVLAKPKPQTDEHSEAFGNRRSTDVNTDLADTDDEPMLANQKIGFDRRKPH